MNIGQRYTFFLNADGGGIDPGDPGMNGVFVGRTPQQMPIFLMDIPHDLARHTKDGPECDSEFLLDATLFQSIRAAVPILQDKCMCQCLILKHGLGRTHWHIVPFRVQVG